MGAKVESSGEIRVIVLASPGAVNEPLHPQVKLVEVNSAYEAAAELLREAPAAMVVDLGRISAMHVRLLALAGEKGVPVVAFGTICTELGGGALATVRLVARDRLGSALTETLELPPAGEKVAPVAEADGRSGGHGKAGPGSNGTVKGSKPGTGPAGDRPARPAGSLTQAELDALLE